MLVGALVGTARFSADDMADGARINTENYESNKLVPSVVVPRGESS